MFWRIFGLNESNVSTGIILTSEQKMNLTDFISKELYHSKYHNIWPDSDLTKHFLCFGNLTLTFDGIQYMIKERWPTWLNDKISGIFIDSINIHHGFGSSILPLSPSIYEVNVFGIIQLFKFGECYPSNHHK